MSATVECRIEDGVARVTLDRPPLNILNIEMLEALSAVLERIAEDESVRVVRLDAVGRAFSAGVDVADHVGPKVDTMMDALRELFECFDRLPQTSVAVVSGAALGGGCELMLATDLCWASESASFGLPEIRLGLFAPPASLLLPRLIGERRALDLLLSGRTLGAEEAERIGLVNAVFPAESLEAEVSRRIDGLLAHSGAALRHAKRAVRAGRTPQQAEVYARIDRQYRDELMRTADAQEGLAAFMEKRQPRWKHG